MPAPHGSDRETQIPLRYVSVTSRPLQIAEAIAQDGHAATGRAALTTRAAVSGTPDPYGGVAVTHPEVQHDRGSHRRGLLSITHIAMEASA